MFGIEIRVGDNGLLARLARAGSVLLGRGKQVEKELNEGGMLGKSERRETYQTDAEESLAMALGKDVELNGEIDRGLEKAMEEM